LSNKVAFMLLRFFPPKKVNITVGTTYTVLSIQLWPDIGSIFFIWVWVNEEKNCHSCIEKGKKIGSFMFTAQNNKVQFSVFLWRNGQV